MNSCDVYGGRLSRYNDITDIDGRGCKSLLRLPLHPSSYSRPLIKPPNVSHICLSNHPFIHPTISLSTHSSTLISTHQFIYPYIYPLSFLPTHSSIHISTHPIFIDPYIYLPIHLPYIYPPSHLPTSSFTHPFTYLPIHLSIYLLTHFSSTLTSTYPFIHPPNHLPTHSFTHPIIYLPIHPSTCLPTHSPQ